MNFRIKHLHFLLLFLIPGAYASGFSLGTGEELLKSRNCPDGIAVSTLKSSRKIKVEGVAPDRLTGLFTAVPEDTPDLSDVEPETRKLRKRIVSIRQDQIFTIDSAESPGRETVRLRDMVRINLFKGLEINAILSRVDQTEFSFTWVGNVEGRPDRGTVSLTYANGVILGRVNIYGEGIFRISQKRPGLFEIEEMDPSDGKFAPPVFPEKDLLRDISPGPEGSYSSDGIIEIMIVWTLDAEAGASAKGSSIQAEIAQAVSLINTTYANSNVAQRVTLVASAGTNYTSSENSTTDLYRLQIPNDEYMDEIHVLRQSTEADCVALITNGFEGSIIGQGFALEAGNSSFFKNYAFSVVDRHYFYYQTLTHELGHNMGAGHELDNPSSPGPQYYSYSSGYHYKVNQFDHWHTMMSYSHEGSYKIEYFSNPDINYDGNPTGLPGDFGNDNARTLDNTMALVDSFGEDLDPDLTACNHLGQAYFDPHSVEPGDELEISMVVCNHGDGPAAGFSIDFYASANTNITDNDYYLGRITTLGMEASSNTTFLWTGLIPEGIPADDYYIGWIIDADDAVWESNEDNNRDYFYPSRLNVTAVIECEYSISPSSQIYSASGGSSSINVTAQSGCPWTAVSQADWITVPSYGASGTGNGSVIYSVSPNSSYLQRTGRIRIEDEYFTVSQDGASPVCTVSILPESRTHSADGGEGAISVSSPLGCGWTAASQADWINITSGQSGTGDGIIQYLVEENENKANRAGQILVEEVSFSILQESPYTSLERQDRIVFPADFRKFDPLLENTWVGATALNLNQDEKSIMLSGKDSDGNTVGFNSSLPDLRPRGQVAKLTSELFELTPQLSTIAGEGDGVQLPLRGITIVGDNLIKRMDGIGHRWIPAMELYLLQGQKNPGQITIIYLYNISTTSASEVVLEWKDADGTIIDTSTRAIQAGGTLFQPLSDLFSFNPDSQEGYLKITSSTEICGFSLSGTVQSFVAFPAQKPSESNALYAPHFILLPDGSGTEIQLINVGLVPVSIVFQSFEDPGGEFETQGTELLPGAMLKGNITEFLPLDADGLEEDQLLTGRIKISISTVGDHEGFEGPMVIGGVVLSGSERNSAGLPLEKTGWGKIIFPHIAQSPDMRIFTGLAIWNINSQEAEITVRAWNSDGEISATKTFSLEPNQRRVGMLDESFYFDPGFSQVGGHLEISSDQPVIAFCLYGDYELEYLAAIGGQKLNDD
ncbi:MAG: reprolysin-like metallopeptidase [Acidobacteriota bacterium]